MAAARGIPKNFRTVRRHYFRYLASSFALAGVGLERTSMSLRHAASVALVGWYLMTPPFSEKTALIPTDSAPLSEWSLENSYDSAVECRQSIEAREKAEEARFTKLTPSPHNPFRIYSGLPEMARFLYLKALSAKCIATNDPRLKGIVGRPESSRVAQPHPAN